VEHSGRQNKTFMPNGFTVVKPVRMVAKARTEYTAIFVAHLFPVPKFLS
jgi:hypothetical protein